jgi:hypothetical protein
MILQNVHIPIFGNMDQAITIAGIYLISLNYTMNNRTNQNPKIIDMGFISLLYMLVVSSIISAINSPFDYLTALYYVFTTWCLKGLIAYFVFKGVTNERDLSLCFISLFITLVVIIIGVAGNMIAFGSLFFLRTDIGEFADSRISYTIFGNANQLSRFILTIMPLLFVYALNLKNKFFCRTIKIICLLCATVPFLGISRAAMLSMTLVMLSLLWRLRERTYILIFLICTGFFFTSPLVIERLEQVHELGLELGKRKETADVSLLSIARQPFFGTGMRSIMEIMEKGGGPTMGQDYQGRTRLSEHNYYLATLVQSGVVGLIILLLLLIKYMVFVYRNIGKTHDNFTNNLLIGSLLALSGIILTTFTGGALDENIIWYQVGLTLAIIKIKVVYPARGKKQLNSLPMAKQRQNMISLVTIR